MASRGRAIHKLIFCRGGSSSGKDFETTFKSERKCPSLSTILFEIKNLHSALHRTRKVITNHRKLEIRISFSSGSSSQLYITLPPMHNTCQPFPHKGSKDDLECACQATLWGRCEISPDMPCARLSQTTSVRFGQSLRLLMLLN